MSLKVNVIEDWLSYKHVNIPTCKNNKNKTYNVIVKCPRRPKDYRIDSEPYWGTNWDFRTNGHMLLKELMRRQPLLLCCVVSSSLHDTFLQDHPPSQVQSYRDYWSWTKSSKPAIQNKSLLFGVVRKLGNTGTHELEMFLLSPLTAVGVPLSCYGLYSCDDLYSWVLIYYWVPKDRPFFWGEFGSIEFIKVYLKVLALVPFCCCDKTRWQWKFIEKLFWLTEPEG